MLSAQAPSSMRPWSHGLDRSQQKKGKAIVLKRLWSPLNKIGLSFRFNKAREGMKGFQVMGRVGELDEICKMFAYTIT